MALCASRCGETALAYAHSRTEGQFSVDVLAWVASWATPVGALLGRGKGDGSGGDGGMKGSYDRIPRKYDWLRPSTASRVSFVDLDEMDRPATASQIPSMMAMSGIPVANNEAVREWEEKVRSRAKKLDMKRGVTVKSVRASGPA